MRESDHRKALLISRIDAQRLHVGQKINRLKRSASPAAAAGSLGRMLGGRFGLLPALAGLVAKKGPRGMTWVRVAAVATLVLPLIGNVLSGKKKRRSANGAQSSAE